MDTVTDISSESQFECEIRDGNKSPNNNLVVISFYAKWCSICKTIAPFVSKLSCNFPRVKFLKVNVEKFPVIVEKYNVNAMPTFVFILNENKIDELKGANASGLESKVIKYSSIYSVKTENSIQLGNFNQIAKSILSDSIKLNKSELLNCSKSSSKIIDYDLINSIRKDFSIVKRMDRKHIPNEIRRKLVECLDKEMCSKREASVAFGIPYATVTAIYKKYCTKNIIDNKVRTKFKTKKLSQNHVSIINKWLISDCSMSLKDIQFKIEKEFKIFISKHTVARTIPNFHFTIKRPFNIQKLDFTEKFEDEKKQYCSRIINANENERELLFIDESIFEIMMRRFHKNNHNDVSVTPKVANLKIKNKIALAVLSKHGLFHYKLYDSNNHETFLEFLDEVMLLILDAGMKNVVFVFNYNNIKDFFEKVQDIVTNNDHELVTLPYSSSGFNPLENLFSNWEFVIRNSEPGEEEQLMSSINRFKEIVTSDECCKYFTMSIDKCQRELSSFM